MLRRATSLIGLPDVGDPFDVAAFRAVRVPENLDAFVPLRQGAAKLSRMPSLLSAVIRLGPGVGWSQADPKLREWALANRAALIAFRQGAERVDGIAHADVDRIWASYLNLGPFVWLAILEASRLEEEGDMAGAWGWYRAVLQMKAHLMQRGTLMERFAFDRSCSTLPSTIATWAADRRTDPASIRKALDDACALEPKPEWETLSLKLDYLQMMNELDRQDGWVAQGSAEDWRVPFLDETLPPDLVHTAHAARRFLLNEPDRSRRVLRLAFANWLAHIQETNVRNRRPVVHAIPFIENRNAHLFFYAVSADAPAGARRVSPQDLASWLMTARDAKLLLHHWPWPALRTSGLRQHHDLVVLLAEELYHRERGKLPPSEAALVGPYLDHLPSDGSDEVDDGTAQRVDDSAISVLGQPE